MKDPHRINSVADKLKKTKIVVSVFALTALAGALVPTVNAENPGREQETAVLGELEPAAAALPVVGEDTPVSDEPGDGELVDAGELGDEDLDPDPAAVAAGDDDELTSDDDGEVVAGLMDREEKINARFASQAPVSALAEPGAARLVQPQGEGKYPVWVVDARKDPRVRTWEEYQDERDSRGVVEPSEEEHRAVLNWHSDVKEATPDYYDERNHTDSWLEGDTLEETRHFIAFVGQAPAGLIEAAQGAPRTVIIEHTGFVYADAVADLNMLFTTKVNLDTATAGNVDTRSKSVVIKVCDRVDTAALQRHLQPFSKTPVEVRATMPSCDAYGTPESGGSGDLPEPEESSPGSPEALYGGGYMKQGGWII